MSASPHQIASCQLRSNSYRLNTPATETASNVDSESTTTMSEFILFQENSLVMSKETSQSYITDDPCEHCATQPLSINARDSLVNGEFQETVGLHPGNAFAANCSLNCEFPYTIQCFLPEPLNWNCKRSSAMVASLTNLARTCGTRLPGTRIVLKLNDHLRGEEGVRGWLLVLQGQTTHIVKQLLSEVEKTFSDDKAVESWITI